MRRGDLINFNSNLYQVKRIFNQNALGQEYLNELREYYMCNITLKSNGQLLFCVLIPEIEYELLAR